MLIGAPLVGGVMVVARPVLSLLFGERFEDATLTLQLLAPSVGMLFLYWSASNLLIAANRTRWYASIHGVSAALNIALNLVLIPRYGINGAAAATLVAEAVNVIPSAVVLRHYGAWPSIGATLVPVAAAAGMSAVLVLAGSGLSLLAQVLIGAAAYAVFVMLLGGRRVAALMTAEPPDSAPEDSQG